MSDPTPKQMEVLKLAAKGLTNREIAKRLWVTESNVKAHLRLTYRTLGVKRRAEAAEWLRRRYAGTTES